MKAITQISLTTLLCITLFSCGIERPLSQLPANNNQTYQVDYLFEHDGCKVYRFMDRGHYVYYTNCNNSVTSVENDSVQIKSANIILKNSKDK